PWEVVEEEEPVVEEPVYVEPEVEEPVYEEPVVEEPVVEEPASGSIDYYSASLGSMPENAGLSESELAAKLEIRRRESTHNYDIYSVSGNHYGAYRSEEHTSELQSRFELVCRLLLQKKKQHQGDLRGRDAAANAGRQRSGRGQHVGGGDRAGSAGGPAARRDRGGR